jgi:hypothetical protein
VPGRDRAGAVVGVPEDEEPEGERRRGREMGREPGGGVAEGRAGDVGEECVERGRAGGDAGVRDRGRWPQGGGEGLTGCPGECGGRSGDAGGPGERGEGGGGSGACEQAGGVGESHATTIAP